MSPSEQWILGLFVVYSIPAFISGVGITVAFGRWRSRKGATKSVLSLLSPERTFEQRDLVPFGFTPMEKGHGLLSDAVRQR